MTSPSLFWISGVNPNSVASFQMRGCVESLIQAAPYSCRIDRSPGSVARLVVRILPPILSRASSTIHDTPDSWSRAAAWRPEMPAPMTITSALMATEDDILQQLVKKLLAAVIITRFRISPINIETSCCLKAFQKSSVARPQTS